MPELAYVNGTFGPIEEAMVSIEDRGFQFGDGVYELVRAYDGRLFRLEEHLRRLARSTEAIRLPVGQHREAWATLVAEAYRRSGYADAKVYLQLTRGQAPRAHVFPDVVEPTTIITVREMDPVPVALREHGVAVLTTPDIRWGRCDVKSVNLMPNVMARQEARERGVFEAIFIREGRVTEGAGSNVMAVQGGRLITPSPGPFILSGITREEVLVLARHLSLVTGIEERDLSLEELRQAEEVCLTATTLEVLPVVRIDGRPVGDGRPGPVTRQLAEAFTRLTRSS